MRIFDTPIRQFLHDAGSDSPTPGGGSIAALCAALGASMGSMVANLTRGAKFEAVKDEMEDLVQTMISAIGHFESLLEQDMESFQTYMRALGMPKSTDEEKQARSSALQESAVFAASVPLRLMRRSLEVMTAAAEVTAKVNKNVISDLAIAVITLEAAVQSAWITVEINLGSIKDVEQRRVLEAEGRSVLAKAVSMKQEVLAEIRKIIGR